MSRRFFDRSTAMLVESAIMRVFDVKLSDIVSISDTDAKKILVFILYYLYGEKPRIIGELYSMTWLYVPNASDEILERYLKDASFRSKIHEVLNQLDYSYDQNLVSRRGCVIAAHLPGQR